MLKKNLKISGVLLTSIALLLGGIAYINPVVTDTSDIVLANPKVWYDEPDAPALTEARAIFLGDSLTNGYKVEQHFNNPKLELLTSGINGERTQGTLNRLNEQFYRLKPQKIFLLIGTNNLISGQTTPLEVAESIKTIITELKTNLPYTEIYVESLYPVNRIAFKTEKSKKMVASRTNETIKEVNSELIRITQETKTTYIDVYPYLLDANGNLNKKYSLEGLHLTEAGYKQVSKVLLPYLEH